MNGPTEVAFPVLDIGRFASVVEAVELASLQRLAAEVRAAFHGRTIWTINSTAVGGGVAEMLPTFLGYARGGGLDVRWLVMRGDPVFYAITKRVHNGLHGSLGDGGLLGADERLHFEAVAKANWEAISGLIRPHDVVVVHDPQPAGLIPHLRRAGVCVLWRCHIGTELQSDVVRRSWLFLKPYVELAATVCFSRPAYAPAWIEASRLVTIQPSIDPFSPKNRDLEPAVVGAVVGHIGLVACGRPAAVDGVRRHADILHAGPLPPPEAPLVVQVSRWDRLKDMVGVMRGFTDHVPDELGAHLALVGPNVHGVTDDPEGEVAYAQVVDVWRRLPHFKRCRVQIVTLPTADVAENALMVNAIQRHAALVAQKSLAEGFGLTVAEAMWKGKAVVASDVGGIHDQITDRRDGWLVRDPTNLDEFGLALKSLLAEPERAAQMGLAARESVRGKFLTTRHLRQWVETLSSRCGEAP